MRVPVLAIIIILFLCITSLPSSQISAMPLKPELLKYLSKEQLKTYADINKAAAAAGLNQPNLRFYRADSVHSSNPDTAQAIIILVDFDDYHHEWDFDATISDFEQLLFSSNSYPTGSMTDFYRENSYGKVILTGAVVGWYRMPQPYSFYTNGQRGFGTYPGNAQKLAEDAVLAADDDVDYSRYDNDADGWVDALFIVHAGPGYEDTGNENFIHSHKWSLHVNLVLDEVRLSDYSMEPEETGAGELVNIGVFCHEFGHMLGLPDLYDRDSSSKGLGSWSVMSYGVWGNGGKTPAHFDAWCKCRLGWVIPSTPQDNIQDVLLPPVESDPVIYHLWTNGHRGSEYFLIENRRKMLFDSELPGEGLLIYHIDEEGYPLNNDDETHYAVGLEQADGRFDHENNRNSDDGDPYPGSSGNQSFDDESVPDSRDYNGEPTLVSISNISSLDNLIIADISIEKEIPDMEMCGYENIEISGDGDQWLEGNETFELVISLVNQEYAAVNASISISCDIDYLDFQDNFSSWDTIPAGSIIDNSHDPIVFSVLDNYKIRWTPLTLQFTSNEGEYQTVIGFEVLIGYPKLFVVDDDNGGPYREYYLSALRSLYKPYVWRDIDTSGQINGIPTGHHTVLWFTGDETSQPVLSLNDIEHLENYLDLGNKTVVFTSQDIVESLSKRASEQDLKFLDSYMGVEFSRSPVDNHNISGIDNTFTEGLNLLTEYETRAHNQTSQDAMLPLNNSFACFKYLHTDEVAGVCNILPNNSIVITFGFGMEAINGDYGGYHHRTDLLIRIFAFIASAPSPELPEVPQNSGYSLSQNVPNPFNDETSIEFHIPSPGFSELTIFNIAGQEIKTLLLDYLPSGEHNIEWNGRDNMGNRTASGIYFYRLTAGKSVSSRQMIMLK
ncbi:MAG: M6 family metalloprotease domain-containing protein [candidate division Zixibacteria bacterium]|nr:M6 family metalloprotease domain-containing protein [candidate division Zixibacteria bacterium]